MENYYVGLADVAGIESFILDPEMDEFGVFPSEGTNQNDKHMNPLYHGMSVRAVYNQQRMSVVYRVLMDDEDAKKVDEIHNEGDEFGALLLIKKLAKETQIGTYGLGRGIAERNWNFIPNKDLKAY